MYKVDVYNPCSCFVKRGLFESNEFTTKEEAKKEADSLLKKMNDEFCKKHTFSMNEQFGDYKIYIKPRG